MSYSNYFPGFFCLRLGDFKNCNFVILMFSRSYQVRGHLAANIDPLGLNNIDTEQAKKMIIRSVTVDSKVSHGIFLQHIEKTFIF